MTEQSRKRDVAAYDRERYRQRIESEPFKEKARYLKARSKQRGIPFDLTAEYLEDLWTGTCPIFETELRLPYAKEGKSHPDPTDMHQPSLDRISPSKGYVPGNVVWMSMMANTIKATATSSQILAVGYWLKGEEEDND